MLRIHCISCHCCTRGGSLRSKTQLLDVSGYKVLKKIRETWIAWYKLFMYVMRYDVNGNDRHLSCLNSVLLTDIATPLYVTKYILYRNCKKVLHLCLRGSILWCPGPNVTESLKTCGNDHNCRIIGNAALDWLKYLRKSQYLSRSSSAVLAEKSCGRGKLDMAVVRY